MVIRKNSDLYRPGILQIEADCSSLSAASGGRALKTWLLSICRFQIKSSFSSATNTADRSWRLTTQLGTMRWSQSPVGQAWGVKTRLTTTGVTQIAAGTTTASSVGIQVSQPNNYYVWRQRCGILWKRYEGPLEPNCTGGIGWDDELYETSSPVICEADPVDKPILVVFEETAIMIMKYREGFSKELFLIFTKLDNNALDGAQPRFGSLQL